MRSKLLESKVEGENGVRDTANDSGGSLSRLDHPDQFAVMWHNFLHPSPDSCRQQCGGTRTWAQVEFCPQLGTDVDCPVMLIMTFAQECLPNHSIRHPDQLPPEVNLPPSQSSVLGLQYKLFGCTFER